MAPIRISAVPVRPKQAKHHPPTPYKIANGTKWKWKWKWKKKSLTLLDDVIKGYDI